MNNMRAVSAVLDNANQFGNPNRPIDRYFRYLIEEVGELSAAMNGRHEHSPATELIQIGGIVINMLGRYSNEEIAQAVEQIRGKHG